MRRKDAAPLRCGKFASKVVCRRSGQFVGLNFWLFAGVASIAALAQAGCVHSSAPPVWGYYDQCAAANPSFLAMAECGRQKRLAECVPTNSCSPEGTVFMDYVDSLALSVKSKKLTEAEAMRRYAEYKSGGASTCARVGAEVKC
jgi:hypothetical protein